MPDVMIAPTQNPIQSGAGNANALRHGGSSGHTDENAGAGASAVTESPFSKVFRTLSDQTRTSREAAIAATASGPAEPRHSGDQPVVIDLPALLQVVATIEASASLSAGIPQTPVTTKPNDDENEKGLWDGQGPANTLATELIAALPSTPGVAETTASRVRIDAQGIRQPNVEQQAETPASAHAPKAGEATTSSGKITPDTAINADIARRGEDVKPSEVPANEFHAVLERAVATATDATIQGNRAGAGNLLRIDTPLGQSGWHDEVGQKLTWMVGSNSQKADLVLTPPHLGRVEVSLTLNGDQATAIFTSPNPVVREALESSLHRLREVLADAGVNLGQTQVGSESPDRSRPGNETDFRRDPSLRDASANAAPLAEVVARTNARAGRGMIDVFA